MAAPAASFDVLAARWRDLAMRRHAHFVELYDSGRWRHYYTEQEFVAELRVLSEMVERWRRIATWAGSDECGEPPGSVAA